MENPGTKKSVTQKNKIWGWKGGREVENEKLQKQKHVKGGQENEMSSPRAGQAVTDGLGDTGRTEPEPPLDSGSMEMWCAVWRTTWEWNENRNGFIWSQRLTGMKGLASSTLTIFDAAVAW